MTRAMIEPTAGPPLGPIIYLIFSLVWIALFSVFGAAVFMPWMRAQSAELPVSMAHVAGMRLRLLPVALIFDAWIELRKSGEAVRLESLEAVYTAHRREVRTSTDLARLYGQVSNRS
jgi:uncharacterized protein YqfA (UPF0365 family)